LKTGDVIVSFGGRTLHGPRELQSYVERMPLGAKEKLQIVRDGKRQTLTVTGREQPADYGVATRSRRQDSPDQPSGTAFENLGLEVSDLDGDVARQLGLKSAEGVVITNVTPDSPADLAGLTTSMAIVQVNRKPVKNVEEFERALKEKSADDGVLLLVRTQQGSRFVVIRSEG
jgi:serine protease Do